MQQQSYPQPEPPREVFPVTYRGGPRHPGVVLGELVESIFFTYEANPYWPLILLVIGALGIFGVELYKVFFVRDPRLQQPPELGEPSFAPAQKATVLFPEPSAPVIPPTAKQPPPAGPPPKASSGPPDTGPSAVPKVGVIPGWGSWPVEPQEEPQTLFEDLPELPFPGEVPSNRELLWATWAAIVFDVNEEKERIVRHDRVISEAWSSFARLGNKLRGHTWEHGYRIRIRAQIAEANAKAKAKARNKAPPARLG